MCDVLTLAWFSFINHHCWAFPAMNLLFSLTLSRPFGLLYWSKRGRKRPRGSIIIRGIYLWREIVDTSPSVLPASSFLSFLPHQYDSSFKEIERKPYHTQDLKSFPPPSLTTYYVLLLSFSSEVEHKPSGWRGCGAPLPPFPPSCTGPYLLP